MVDQHQAKRPGDLNPVFNNGKVTLDHTGADGYLVWLELTAQGNILVLSRRSGVQQGYYLSRFTPQGTLDTSFGATKGFFLFEDPVFPDRDQFHQLDDGSFLVTGGGHADQLSITRFHAHGALDTAYGVGGHAIVRVSDLNIEGRKDPRILVSSPDLGLTTDQQKRLPPKSATVYSAADSLGAYLVFTATWGDFEQLNAVVVRIDGSGELDRAFNKTGYVVETLAGSGITYNVARQAVLQTRGQQSELVILVQEALKIVDPLEGNYFMLRYDVTGQRHFDFGGCGNDQGLARIDWQDFFIVYSLWAGEDGALKVIGSTFDDENFIGAVRGYTDQGKQDLSFYGGQLLLTEIEPGYGNWHRGIFYTEKGETRMVLSGPIPSRRLIGIARLLGDGQFDKNFGEDGKAAFDRSAGPTTTSHIQLLSDKDIILGDRNDIWWLKGGEPQ
ncbi:hypothetical protein [Pseudomonas sp. MWU16-30317]|uniref:hypothetical protein n=1 Tax=Pseudomonas sp. MWU16-30317 TaxID=2878095 RepID=UPI001CF9EE72|nr:hypothetical protein [Pseudomonas sp. MWU16-30317]